MSDLEKQTNGTFISIGLAAETTGYPEDLLRELAEDSDFTATRVGQKWFIDRVELERYVSENKPKSSASLPVKENRLSSRWRLTKDGHRPVKQEVIERSMIPRALVAAVTTAVMILLVAGLLPVGGDLKQLAITPKEAVSQEADSKSLLTASVSDARYAVQLAAVSVLETSADIINPLKGVAAASVAFGVEKLVNFGDLIVPDMSYSVPEVFASPRKTLE